MVPERIFLVVKNKKNLHKEEEARRREEEEKQRKEEEERQKLENSKVLIQFHVISILPF